MSREIKFRAKTMATGEWAYGCFAARCPGDCYIGKIGAVEGRHVHFEGELCYTNTLGQFTGLHDSEGKEIFEGDIVRDARWDGLFEVRWCDGKGEFLGIQVGWIIDDKRYSQELVAYLGSMESKEEYFHGVVVGNVRDNPELMSEQS